MMNRQSQWLFEAPFSLGESDGRASHSKRRISPGSQRQSKFTSRQIRDVFRDARKIAVEGQPPNTTIRTEKSEKARHRDLTQGIQGHHAFPKYLGGLKRQALAYIPPVLHYLYHQEVDRIVQLPRSGKVYKKLNYREKQAILHKLLAHAEDFDRRYGTKILPSMRTAIRAAQRSGSL